MSGLIVLQGFGPSKQHLTVPKLTPLSAIKLLHVAMLNTNHFPQPHLSPAASARHSFRNIQLCSKQTCRNEEKDKQIPTYDTSRNTHKGTCLHTEAQAHTGKQIKGEEQIHKQIHINTSTHTQALRHRDTQTNTGMHARSHRGIQRDLQRHTHANKHRNAGQIYRHT